MSYLFFGWGGWIRTNECRHQKPMPYHLATPQQIYGKALVLLKLSPYMPKNFSWQEFFYDWFYRIGAGGLPIRHSG